MKWLLPHLRPRLTWGRYDGDTEDGGGRFVGAGFTIEWLGLLIEIAVGGVRR